MRQASKLAFLAVMAATSAAALTVSSVVIFAGCSATTPAMVELDAAPGCSSDSQCAGATPRCDLKSGTCVLCLPQQDNCPIGSHCAQAAGGAFTCDMTCRDSNDCPKFGAASGVCCAGSCFDVTGDVLHCGACGTSCPMAANGMVACAKGACVVGSCDQGHADCDAALKNGCETDTTTDVQHCGNCSTVCRAGANASAACQAGVCSQICKMNFGDCNSDASDGCEVDLTGDSGNCGACNNRCPLLPHATPSCMGGMCGIGACDQGYLDCDRSIMNGCEVNLINDKMNCGACGTVCAAPNATPACKSGVCGYSSCTQGYADCDSMAANGCEVNIAADPANCGACRNFCVIPHAMALCTNSACAVGACLAGYADCNMVAADGCEHQVSADVQNCGMCGAACAAVLHGTPGCANSMCNIASCNAGFANCSGNVKTGCETDITTTMNCGKCGAVCPVPANATAACAAGVCGVGMCNGLFGDCDKNAANGCELPLAVDPSNCGACGKVCTYANAAATCANGVCAPGKCNVGFGDCDQNAANGCEAVLASDAKNCGACGNVCGGKTPYCSSGACTSNPCTGQAGGPIGASMGGPSLGFCWYLSIGGATCDAVCAASGGTNQAVAALAVLPEDCMGGTAGAPSRWFFENANSCSWVMAGAIATGYKTLGHGYHNDMAGRAPNYYGKCGGGLNGSGTLPGDVNDSVANGSSRCVVCACDH